MSYFAPYPKKVYFNNATKVLQHDYLLNCIMDHIWDLRCEDTTESSDKPLNRVSPCTPDPCIIHDWDIVSFLQVSKQWFRVIAPRYWKLAYFNQLRIFIEVCRENGVRVICCGLFYFPTPRTCQPIDQPRAPNDESMMVASWLLPSSMTVASVLCMNLASCPVC